jgi:monofunctional biosynthetic peptidoglycan transglycosylase
MTAPRTAGRRRWLVRGALIALLLAVGGLALLWFTLPDPAQWATRPPTTTALIEQRRAEARAAGRRYQPVLLWVPLERLPRRLVDAVVAAEDATFFQHRGFDWEALGVALRHNLQAGRYARGASTITQQLAKNLALGTEKSLLRKGREALLTIRLERRLDKRRLLALYLNVAEWGDGAFGVEAGARRHFSASAASLSTAQSVLLAAMLPAPRRARLSPAPAWLAARARGLLQRLVDEQVIPASELPGARLELERYLGAPRPASPAEEEPPVDEPEELPPTPASPSTEPPAEAPAAPPVEAPVGPSPATEPATKPATELSTPPEGAPPAIEPPATPAAP